MPSPGDVDIVVASELVEAGRVMQRGLVTPGRTTLIASTHRAYTISEKSHTGDGRASSERILEEAARQSKRFVALDMAAIAEQHGAVISSVILGAIAGASGLPFARETYREAIRAGGIAVERNLAAFDAGAMASAAPAPRAADTGSVAPEPSLPTAVSARIAAELPLQVRPLVSTAAARLIDYQDEAHAVSYLDALRRFCAIDVGHPGEDARLTRAVAKGLALWMSFEDTIRVADLKTRADRQRRVRASAHAKPGQLVRVTEFMKPRVEEICGTLPANLGRRILGSATAVRWLGSMTEGREIHTSTISGYALLRLIGGLRRWRRGTLRFHEEAVRAGPLARSGGTTCGAGLCDSRSSWRNARSWSGAMAIRMSADCATSIGSVRLRNGSSGGRTPRRNCLGCAHSHWRTTAASKLALALAG